jgi:hypothetical protein
VCICYVFVINLFLRFERYRGLALALSATNLGEAAGPALSAMSKADIYIHLALRTKHSFSGRGFLCARFYLARARQICQALNGNAPPRLQWLCSPAGYRFFLSHHWEYDDFPSTLFTSLGNKSDPLAFTMQVRHFCQQVFFFFLFSLSAVEIIIIIVCVIAGLSSARPTESSIDVSFARSACR